MTNVWHIGESLKTAEKRIIEKALNFYGHNKTMTADSLGISIRGLDGKMQKLGIEYKKKGSIDEKIKAIKSDSTES